MKTYIGIGVLLLATIIAAYYVFRLPNQGTVRGTIEKLGAHTTGWGITSQTFPIRKIQVTNLPDHMKQAGTHIRCDYQIADVVEAGSGWSVIASVSNCAKR